MTLDDIYRQRAATPSDIVEHLEFMHDLVVELGAQVVVELGVRSGNSTAALLSAVEQTGGHLWSVDVVNPSWPVEFHVAECGTLIVADDLSLDEVLPEQIDVLFVDTSHHYDHTLAELRMFGPRSTRILLHDTELEHPHMAPATDPPFPVKEAVRDWCLEAGRAWTNRTNCWGLALIDPLGGNS